MWVQTTNGPVNLAVVTKIVCQANGDAYLYLDAATNYVTASWGVNQAEALTVAERLVGAVDPADY